jgi:hypothetical protein
MEGVQFNTQILTEGVQSNTQITDSGTHSITILDLMIQLALSFQ